MGGSAVIGCIELVIGYIMGGVPNHPIGAFFDLGFCNRFWDLVSSPEPGAVLWWEPLGPILRL